jgi:hypothetical protein
VVDPHHGVALPEAEAGEPADVVGDFAGVVPPAAHAALRGDGPVDVRGRRGQQELTVVMVHGDSFRSELLRNHFVAC